MMIRTLAITMMMAVGSAWASDLDVSGFNKRFELVKENGTTKYIRLKTLSARFSLKPFLQQIKNDLLEEQRRLGSKGFADQEALVDEQLLSMGLDPYAKEASEEIRTIKDALLNVPNIKVNESFSVIENSPLMREFESRIQDALMLLDLSVVGSLEDPRFFYKKNVAYQVVIWALDLAKKQFADVPLLNLASYVIVKVHDLLHEQRMFHHNMMLQYFDKVPESQLGMTKEEVDRAISSIYEYRIAATNFQESNRAVAEWAKYGWANFFVQVRAGNTRSRDLSTSGRFSNPERISFGFAEMNGESGRQIIHLFHNQHMLSSKPAVAYDYANPDKVKRERALINLGQLALGFVPYIPGFIKDMADTFLNSMHKEQRLVEGALVAYFEMNGNAPMVNAVYRQNINPYLVR